MNFLQNIIALKLYNTYCTTRLKICDYCKIYILYMTEFLYLVFTKKKRDKFVYVMFNDISLNYVYKYKS